MRLAFDRQEYPRRRRTNKRCSMRCRISTGSFDVILSRPSNLFLALNYQGKCDRDLLDLI